MQQDTVAAAPATNKQTTTLQQATRMQTVDVTRVTSNPAKTTSNAKPKLIDSKTEEKKPKAVMSAENQMIDD